MFKTTFILACEVHARWAVRVINGDAKMPDRAYMDRDMERSRQFRVAKPQPAQDRIPFTPYVDEISKNMGHAMDLNALKESNENLYLKFINLPVLQVEPYLTTAEVEKQIEIVDEIRKSSVVKR